MRGTELGKQDNRAVPLSLTAAAFQRQRLRHSGGRRFVIPARSRLLEAAFRSPTTTVRLRTTIAGSKFPACFFDALPDPSSSPSTSCSTAIRWFAPREGRFHARDP